MTIFSVSNSNENYTHCVNITVRHTFKTLKVAPTGSYCIILCPTVHYWVISGHILHLWTLCCDVLMLLLDTPLKPKILILCLGETISIFFDMERQNFEVDGWFLALCQSSMEKMQITSPTRFHWTIVINIITVSLFKVSTT